MTQVENTVFFDTDSFKTSFANTTLLKNCTPPRAASNDWAAKENDAKFIKLPKKNKHIPVTHKL